MEYEHLFQSIKIGPVEIKNRIAFAQNGQMYADPFGYVSEQTLAYFAARAKGGAGLIMMGTVQTNELGWATNPINQLHLYDDDHISGMAELAERVHAFDAKIFIQLSVGFGRAGSSKARGVNIVSASAIPLVIPEEHMLPIMKVPGGYTYETPRELTIDEIIDMEDKFAEAALRAKIAGMDGIELHTPHGYLFAQFLSPRVNKRTDLYGGCLENRMRFALNCIRKTREKIGHDIALGARLSGDEHAEGGLTHEELKLIAKAFGKEGIDFLSVSDGSGYDRMDYLLPSEDGTMLEESAGFKSVLNIPVITPSIHDPTLANQAIKEGKMDMLGLCRPLLADPEWPNKVREGRINEIRRCKRDNFCIANTLGGKPLRCIVNPDLGRERYISEYWQPPYKVKK